MYKTIFLRFDNSPRNVQRTFLFLFLITCLITFECSGNATTFELSCCFAIKKVPSCKVSVYLVFISIGCNVTFATNWLVYFLDFVFPIQFQAIRLKGRIASKRLSPSSYTIATTKLSGKKGEPIGTRHSNHRHTCHNKCVFYIVCFRLLHRKMRQLASYVSWFLSVSLLCFYLVLFVSG